MSSFQGKKFSNIIDTDGVAVSFHFLRVKATEPRKRQKEWDVDRSGNSVRRLTPHVRVGDDARVIANDPGRRVIFQGYEEVMEEVDGEIP